MQPMLQLVYMILLLTVQPDIALRMYAPHVFAFCAGSAQLKEQMRVLLQVTCPFTLKHLKNGNQYLGFSVIQNKTSYSSADLCEEEQ